MPARSTKPSTKTVRGRHRGPLAAYDAKRDFAATPEPRGKRGGNGRALRFVIQRHDASHLHYDFRLELDGTLKSWALPKQPSPDVTRPRLAVQVEDHPLAYADFEGDIPAGNYGAGHVDIWDSGSWEPDGNARRDYANGKLSFTLHGERLKGHWTLVRTDKPARQPQWLLLHRRDDKASKPSASASPPKAPATGNTNKDRSGRTGRPARAAPTTRSARSARSAMSPPAHVEPMLATLVDTAPASAGWHAEVKLDGYRVLIRIDGDDIRVFTRSGQDWTHRFSAAVRALRARKLPNAWLDGEAVVMDAHGLPDFQALQRAFDENATHAIVIYVFDLPWCNGQDLRETPLRERQAALAMLFDEGEGGEGDEGGEGSEGGDQHAVRFLQPVAGELEALWHGACDAGLEGIMIKRDDSPYVSGRSDAWRKLKCSQRQEFIVLGFTEPSGSRQGLGALLLGYYDDDGKTLRYAGKVGTGFDTAGLVRLRKRLDTFETPRAPLSPAPHPGGRAPVHWLRPGLVAEVRFAQWTRGGNVRQASFVAMRDDKQAKEIRREAPRAGRANVHEEAPSMTRAAPSKNRSPALPMKITHGERVMDTLSGVTKAELAAYYHAVSEWMLPHLAQRPFAVLRAPEGIGGEMFFQKHAAKTIPGVHELDPALDPDHQPLMQIDDARGLVGAVQMGTIEFHTWNARSDLIERPDRVIFDLDPGKGVEFGHIRDGAELIRSLMEALGLEAFVKTSGGKGLHVVTPLARRHDWDLAKGFAERVARHMTRVFPDRFTATMGPKHRVGKCFIDYLRNYRGATTVCAYSARAREGMAVSMPIAWDELPDLERADQWNVRNALERLRALGRDPWAGYEKASQQRITKDILERLGD
ncbi:DNA ligase D [Pandoraea nosoerga]|uniref:DNA ligase (ATP) n=1 Tax=Pandoraea nosoerga TaxID=2508296 RepID=A0A5E4RKY3_9BURK|nr:DNA ligase D [Pandoraea nosoerga]MBN4664476.1 DNA ligase D [Pandoraea nosoerga]MBN4674488.1 DNA ligase D [Pandoraea nosoerga]MBN4679756.1 DNA ligase D [Pandoraea nosoerga]MBN4743156.1 DNA ligase D [Pandoraea nosoerga]VVD63184.1 DNA ligase D [Pandoraea nosoerga]